MTAENRYEALSEKLKTWYDKKLATVTEGLMGGQRPPWSVKMTPEMKREYLSRLSPQEAQQLWGQMTPEEQDEIRRLMAPQGGGRNAGIL